MSSKNEKLQAFLDGQLSEEEKKEYLNSLSPKQKEELSIERNFNQVIDQKLKAVSKSCPDQLWDSIKKDINASSQERPKIVEVSNFQNMLPTLLKFAAIILVSLFVGIFLKPDNSKLKLEKQLSLLKPSIQGELKQIQELLNQQGYEISFKSLSHAAHPVNFIGMDWIKSNHEKFKAARLIFSCCDIPVFVYVKAASDRPSKPFDVEREHRKLIHHLKKGDDRYLIDAYSDHPPAEVLDLIY